MLLCCEVSCTDDENAYARTPSVQRPFPHIYIPHIVIITLPRPPQTLNTFWHMSARQTMDSYLWTPSSLCSQRSPVEKDEYEIDSKIKDKK